MLEAVAINMLTTSANNMYGFGFNSNDVRSRAGAEMIAAHMEGRFSKALGKNPNKFHLLYTTQSFGVSHSRVF
jgi:hypothetical protein